MSEFLNILLNGSWWYSYPNPIDFIIIVFVTIAIESIIISVVLSIENVKPKTFWVLIFSVFIANLISAIVGYLWFFGW